MSGDFSTYDSCRPCASVQALTDAIASMEESLKDLIPPVKALKD